VIICLAVAEINFVINVGENMGIVNVLEKFVKDKDNFDKKIKLVKGRERKMLRRKD
jgi:hypothetical protein